MKVAMQAAFVVMLVALQVAAHENVKYTTDDVNSNKINSLKTSTINTQQKSLTINNGINSTLMTTSLTELENGTTAKSFSSSLSPHTPSPLAETITTSTTLSSLSSPSSSAYSLSTISSFTSTTPTPTKDHSARSNQYCSPSLCEFYNGSHTHKKPHIACKNSGNFGPACGLQPHLLKMSERRRNLILDLHNLARSRIASGQVVGYESASDMPQLTWDNELEYLATLHVKRCRFEHDSCRNTPRFPYSGQNIGYFWKSANITSHSKRIKNFIINWYQEHKDANQSFIDAFHLHPEEKAIGHFTTMVADRVHHVGCAVVRFYESNLTQILMTCNYDYNNIQSEPVYQTGPTASKCAFKKSDKYAGLCEWKKPVYEYARNGK